jgi:hypothetical protein
LYRHGARYPTTGSLPTAFSAKLQQATKSMQGFNATGDLSFLNGWTYKLGAELLTPFGRLQNFELGVEFRQLYGHLLNNFTEQGALPVFRTESQDRMVKTAQNFAAGFFGVPEKNSRTTNTTTISLSTTTMVLGHPSLPLKARVTWKNSFRDSSIKPWPSTIRPLIALWIRMPRLSR